MLPGLRRVLRVASVKRAVEPMKSAFAGARPACQPRARRPQQPPRRRRYLDGGYLRGTVNLTGGLIP